MLKKKNHRIAIKKNQAPYTVAQRRKCTASVEFTSGFIFKWNYFRSYSQYF